MRISANDVKRPDFTVDRNKQMSKSSIDILESYGTVRFEMDEWGIDQICNWNGGEYERVGYGRTKEESAMRVVEALKYMMHASVRDIVS